MQMSRRRHATPEEVLLITLAGGGIVPVKWRNPDNSAYDVLVETCKGGEVLARVELFSAKGKVTAIRRAYPRIFRYNDIDDLDTLRCIAEQLVATL